MKNISKLRPLNIDHARHGAPICYHLDGDVLQNVCITPDGVITGTWGNFPDSRREIWQSHSIEVVFRMAPLAWVENDPIYAGDTVYGPSGHEYIVFSVVDGVFIGTDVKTQYTNEPLINVDCATLCPPESGEDLNHVRVVKLYAWLINGTLTWHDTNTCCLGMKWERVPGEDKTVTVCSFKDKYDRA